MLTDKKTVYVGISGGVDSSVSAALLKEQGFNVVGVFIKIWHPELSNCDWKSEMRDAMRVCAHLDIKFKMIDLSEEYYEEVIKYLINEYKIGNTPNPDVMCNKIIKFGHFYDWAVGDGADFVATGHYAYIENSKMYRGVDEDKDQTYFLWNIKKDSLKNTIFPVGKFKKEKVREIAKKIELPTATKKDSQGLCFVGDVDLKAFLKKHLDTKDGNVLDESGEVIGKHQGSELYTIGERHGFRIDNDRENQIPHYVISKDLKKNTITVSENFNNTDNKIKSVELKNINILVDEIGEKDIEVKVRYGAKLNNAILREKTLIFREDQNNLASGQSIVFYRENVCLGGGVVDFTE